jgi:AcrR family transcriptional regulator
MTLEHTQVRETLVKMTLKLMEKGGLEDVKARRVAELAGVSVGTIYNLFGSFDRLILAANIRIYDDLGALGLARAGQAEAEIARTGIASPRERVLLRLSRLADAYVDFVAANSGRWSALLAFNRTRGLSGDEDNLKHLDALIGIIADMLEEAPLWPVAEERRRAARALWSSVHGIVSTNYFAGNEVLARQSISALLGILLGTLVDGMFAPRADMPVQ